MRNIKELRESLADNYESMKADEMELKKGKELSNTAGKIISSLKIELEYQSALGVKKEISFLKYK
jgi:hypothetical protein|tara:strand:+ start:263 stop:457 length:195 start_codon:yes stop_codon:yes gene_type:complete